MVSSNPLVSIVIPIYNGEKYIEESISCLLRQTYTRWEAIFVDDGSEDNTLSILINKANQDNRIRYISQQNQFAGVARNSGMKLATGKYICFWDVDDFFDDCILEKMVRKAEIAAADIVICGSKGEDILTGQKYALEGSLSSKWLGTIKKDSVYTKDVELDLFQLTAGWAWDKLYSFNFIKEKKIKFQDTRIANDELFTDIAFAEAEIIAFVPEALITHRENISESISNNRDLFWKDALRMLRTEKEELICREKYECVKRSFQIRVSVYLIWYLYTLRSSEAFLMFFQELKNQLIDEFGLLDADITEESKLILNQTLICCDGTEMLIWMLHHTNHILEETGKDREILIHHSEDLENHLNCLRRNKVWRFEEKALEGLSKVVVYGYGDMGHDYVNQIVSSNDIELVGIIDANLTNDNLEGYAEIKINELSQFEYDWILVAVWKKETYEEIRDELLKNEVPEKKILWFDYTV